MTRHPDLPDIDDPTRTQRMQKVYKKEIKGLYLDFVDPLLQRIQPTIAKYDKLSLLDDISNDIDMEMHLRIDLRSRHIVEKNITLTYRSGKRDASNNPRIKKQHVVIPVEMNPLDQDAIKNLFARNLNLIDNISQNVKTQVLMTIETGIRQHEGINKIARDLKNKIPEIADTRAKVIARTELAYAYNTAISNSYQAAGIKQWQWLSALAETTCQDCQNLHGQVFDWGEPEPPLHPNCLCTEYPIVLEPFEK